MQSFTTISDAFGRDLEQAQASNGTVGGRLHEFVTDVFSKWLLDTAECEGSKKNSNFSQPEHKSSLIGIALFAPEATYTEGGCDGTGPSDLESSASRPLGDSTRRRCVGTPRHGQNGQHGR